MKQTPRRPLEKNEYCYLVFRFFQDFALIYPVYVIFFQQTGLDFIRIAQLLAIWAAAMMFLEIPSGILADLWSKRGSIFIALLLKAAGFLIWLIRPDFTGFAIGFVFWGFQEALCSGTTDALLFESLKASGRQDDFEAVAGLGMLSARIAIAISLLLGGRVFSFSPGWALGVSSMAMVLAGVSALFLTEEKQFRDAGGSALAEEDTPGDIHGVPQLRETLREIARTVGQAALVPGLIALVFFGSFTAAVYGVLDEYDFLFGKLNGVPLAWIGVWGMVRFGFEGAGGWLAPYIALGFKKNALRRFVLWTAAAGALIVTGTVLGFRMLLPFYFLFYGMMAAAEVIYHGHIQRTIESKGRATVSSMISFVYTAFGIGIGLFFGWIADAFSFPIIFPVGGGMIIAAAAAYRLYGVHDPAGPAERP